MAISWEGGDDWFQSEQPVLFPWRDVGKGGIGLGDAIAPAGGIDGLAGIGAEHRGLAPIDLGERTGATTVVVVEDLPVAGGGRRGNIRGPLRRPAGPAGTSPRRRRRENAPY